MKIPPSTICAFTRDTWPDFVGYFEGSVEKLIRVGECPVEARTMVFGNAVAHPDMLYRTVPAGLWKAVLHCYNAAGEGFSVIIQMRLLQDGYF